MKPLSFRLHILPYTFVLLFAAAFLSAANLTTCAQSLDTVTITGRVIDQNGAVIPGASVIATLTTTKVERAVVTGEEGLYRIIELPPGVYNVRASFRGFAAEEKTNLTTVAGQNVQLDFTLKPAGVTAEQVVVSEAEPPVVDTTRTVVGGTVTTQEVESLPNVSRSPLDLIFTLGGVTEEPLSTRNQAEDRFGTGSQARSTPEEAGIFALSGGPAYSNNITIDGLDNNDDRSARERFQPSIEAVAEVQIITNQFSAEYGRASGGRVNIRTRGGSNKLRGRAFYFYRNDIFNANTPRNKSFGLSRLPLEEHDPGFTLGGPVVLPKFLGPLAYNGRSRTFFFASYEYDDVLDSAAVSTFVPVLKNSAFPLPGPTNLSGRRFEIVSAPAQQAEIAPFFDAVSTPFKNKTATARIDHKYTDMHNAFAVYQRGRQINLRQFGGGTRLAQALVGKQRNTDAISYSDNYIFNSKTVNQARFQFSRLTPAVESAGGRGPVVLIALNVPRDIGTGSDRSTLTAGASTTGATDRREIRYQFQDTVSLIAGPHSMKFGFDVQRIRSTFIDLSDATGTFNFSSAGDFLAGIVSRYRHNFNTESTQRNTYYGIFAQDEWRLRRNLTFSLGLRYERETIIKDTNNFGPRLAAAWDPLGTGKTVVRIGAGLFYNRVLLQTRNGITSPLDFHWRLA